jgi:hypothetical protein
MLALVVPHSTAGATNGEKDQRPDSDRNPHPVAAEPVHRLAPSSFPQICNFQWAAIAISEALSHSRKIAH